MRLIGHTQDEASARTLGDYMASLNVRNLIEPDTDGSWAVWVHAEDQLEQGRQILEQFLKNPKDPRFIKARGAATALSERDQQEQETYAKRVYTSKSIWLDARIGPVTLMLLVCSVVVFVMQQMPRFETQVGNLYISEFVSGARLPEVQQGQVWRLLTPIFLHFGFLHILFNMLWLKDLGSMIEFRQGPIRLLFLVVFIGILSNLGQFFMSGPNFGGMSGVVYGLLGYIWMRGRSNPASGLFLHPQTITMMIAWFFLCLFNFIPGVANGAHGVGLVVGMLWGWLPL